MAKKIKCSTGTWYIYYLFDPRSNELKYIGKTGNPAQRLNGHLNDIQTSKKDRWIKELMELGLTPVMRIAEECEHHVAPYRETFHIRQAIVNGSKLLNSNAQSINLKRTTGVNIILPNKSLLIFDILATSEKIKREDLIVKILVKYTDNLDLTTVETDIENFADFITGEIICK